tara:strand:- start:55 stop:1320 length:1266 start_codon:yes stop_codon:yes gene_type:complete
MSKKISPSERIRNEITKLLNNLSPSDGSSGALSRLARLSAGLVSQEGMEAEQREFIGAERYERVSKRRGYRSGYESRYLKSAEGPIAVQVPQVRGTETPFRSKLFDFLRGNSQVLERLAIEMYARGLSTRDVESALTDEDGHCLLSRSAVSEVTEALYQEYQAFQSRDLSEIPVLYLFLDGLYEPLRTHGITKEAILCAWAITWDGRKVLLSMTLGGKESSEAWLEFLRDLAQRGLQTPLAVTTNGNRGLIPAVDQMWPNSLRLRCWVHKMRNFASKVPDDRWGEVKPYLLAIRDAQDLESAQDGVERFLRTFGKEFSNLCKSVTEDLDALLANTQLPWCQRRYVRSTNLIERSFVEERRRTKTIPRFFNEKSCLKLVFATLTRAAERWKTIPFTRTEFLQLKALCEERGVQAPSNIYKAA